MSVGDQSTVAKKTGGSKQQEKGHHVISICLAAGCLGAGAEEVRKALEKEIKRRKLESRCSLRAVTCMGLCAVRPRLSADGGKKMFMRVKPTDVAAILDDVVDGKPAPREIRFRAKQRE